MPRLAYLLKKFPRLSETFVLGELLGQEARGHELHVFSRRAADDEPRHPELGQLRAKVELMPSVRTIDPWHELFANGADTQSLLGDVRRVYESFGHLAMERLPTLMAEALWLKRRCAELDIGHLHVHFATEAAVTAMLLRSLGGPSFSVTAHAKDIYRESVDPERLSAILTASEFVVTVCDANVDFMASKVGAVARRKVRRLYNGIDLASFELERRPRPGQILSVGRMVEKKGFLVLVEALSLLAREGVSFRAVLAGEGEERARIAEAVRRAGLAGCVELPGPVDQDAVRELMATSEVFCLPCLIGRDGNRDALPTVLLEAQAAGLPIVSTPVTGIPEILDSGAAGVLVPENDPRATAAALTALLADGERRATLAAAGRERAAALFDRRENARILGAWFSECLERARDGERCASSI